jgi:hypothetical protein
LICSERLSRATRTLSGQPHRPMDGGIVYQHEFEVALCDGLADRLADAMMPMGGAGCQSWPKTMPPGLTLRRTVARRLSPGEIGPTWLRGALVGWSATVRAAPLTSCSLLQRPKQTGVRAIIAELHDQADFTMRYVSTTLGAIGTGPPFPAELGASLQSTHVLRLLSIMSLCGECQSPRSRVLRRAARADPESFVNPSWLEPFSVDPTEATPPRESLIDETGEVVSVES